MKPSLCGIFTLVRALCIMWVVQNVYVYAVYRDRTVIREIRQE
jgi:hypothetical protein